MMNMMKKGLVLVWAVALVLPVLVQAEEGALRTKPTLDTNKVERADKMSDLKNKLEERRVGNQEKRENRVSNHLKLVTERINHVLTQLDGLLVRADKFMAQLETRGIDTSKARAAQKEVITALDTAKSALADLPNRIGSPANAEKLTPAETQTIRQAIQNVTKLTKTAAQKGQDLIKIVRGLRPKSVVTPATTLPEPTTEIVPERIN